MGPRAEYVTSISAGFKTPSNTPDGHDDKDDDTVITVTVLDDSGNQIGQFKGYGGGFDGKALCNYLDNDGYHAVPVPIPLQFSSQYAQYFTVTIRIDTNGNDTWIFMPCLVVTYEISPQQVFMPHSYATGWPAPWVTLSKENAKYEYTGQFFPATGDQLAAFGTATQAAVPTPAQFGQEAYDELHPQPPGGNHGDPFLGPHLLPK